LAKDTEIYKSLISNSTQKNVFAVKNIPSSNLSKSLTK